MNRRIIDLGLLVAALVGSSSLFAQEALEILTPVIVSDGEVGILPLPFDELTGSSIEDVRKISVREVYLGKDSTIIFPPFQSIEILNLISEDGARIQMAGPGSSGRFFIHKILGHIVLESRGENGRDGRDGRAGRQGLNGERGRSARSLLFGLIWFGDGERGRAGYPGENGEAGEDGGSGGDGGEISLYYLEKSADSKILIDVEGGQAGRAGREGTAGLGGNGGDGGRGSKKGLQGPMGISGHSGKTGRPGLAGQAGRASVYQLPPELFQCFMELDARSLFEDLFDEDYALCSGLVADSDFSNLVVQSAQPYDLSQDGETVWISSDGSSGRDGVEASAGGNGGRMTLLFRSVPERVLLSSNGGRGGSGANGHVGARGADGSDGRNAGLFKRATPGTDGQNGSNGGSGSHAAAGGKSGEIRVIRLMESEKSDTHWMDRISISAEGGEGGIGGRGAPGGRGGLGGSGGKKFLSSKRESDGRSGWNGSAGLDGQNGDQGDRGFVEFIEAASLSDWITQEFKEQTLRLKLND